MRAASLASIPVYHLGSAYLQVMVSYPSFVSSMSVVSSSDFFFSSSFEFVYCYFVNEGVAMT